MRLVTYRCAGSERLGLIRGDSVIDMRAAVEARAAQGPGHGEVLAPCAPEAFHSMQAFISAGPAARAVACGVAAALPPDTAQSRPLADVELLGPIPRPRKNIFCVGLNYAAHISEGAAITGRTDALPEVPVFFTKPPTAVIGHGAAVRIQPRVTGKADFEVELAVVIGEGGADIPAAKAWDHVFGYTILNDVSARDLQKRYGQWFKGKSLDTFAPTGPWIVTADEIPDPHVLPIALRLNGEVMQQSSTEHMIFRVDQLIEHLSAGMTLEPGDIIATGTPHGVGFARQPPVFLRDGDVLEAEIGGIGVLMNRVIVVAE